MFLICLQSGGSVNHLFPALPLLFPSRWSFHSKDQGSVDEYNNYRVLVLDILDARLLTVNFLDSKVHIHHLKLVQEEVYTSGIASKLFSFVTR